MIGKSQLPDLFGFLGTLLLLLPALRANAIAKRSARINAIVFSIEDDRLLHELRDQVGSELNKRIGSWSRLDEIFLIFGLGLVSLSFVTKLLLSLA
jgi:hypothetical protein